MLVSPHFEMRKYLPLVIIFTGLLHGAEAEFFASGETINGGEIHHLGEASLKGGLVLTPSNGFLR
ncbi:hypothetical protein N9224_00475 [Akkermansiaceae bacterium]|nr:hypothetical protein [Akkermansiaceae bacterium]